MGNVRKVIDDEQDAQLWQNNSYSAFGLLVPGTVTGISTESSAKANDRYYNGKEAQDVVGWYDFGARMYNPEIGRWMNVDPSHEDGGQESFTPYGYVFNNPIKLTDPDGKMPCCGGNPAAALLTQAQSQWEGIKNASSNFLNRAESFVNQAATYTDFNDAAVLVTTVTRGGNGINTDGSKATVGDIVMAAVGAVIPVVSGSAVKRGVGAVADKVKDILKIDIADANKIDRNLLDPPTKHGNAPTFKKDASKVEIHHEGQNPNGPFKEMHKTEHRGKGNDGINHPNKAKPSQVDRKEFKKAREEYWKEQYPKK